MKLLYRCVSIFLASILTLAPLPGQTQETPASPANAAGFESLQVRLIDSGNGTALAGSKTSRSFVVEVTDSKGSAVADAAVVLRLPDTDPTGTFADGSHAVIIYTDQTGRASINGIQWASTPGIVAIRATATRGTAHAGILIQETLTPVSSAPSASLPAQAAPAEALPPAVSDLPQPAPPHVEIEHLSKTIAPGQPASAAPSLSPLHPQVASEPSVSVTSAAPGESKHSSKTKWIILAAIAAAAGGAGVAMMGKKSSSSTSTAPGISIGPPTVSVGHP